MNITERTLITRVELLGIAERVRSRNDSGEHNDTLRTLLDARELITELQELSARLLTTNYDLRHKWAEVSIKNSKLVTVNDNLKEEL